MPLRSWLAAGKTEWRLAFRAQIILALADGLTNEEAAGRLAHFPSLAELIRVNLVAKMATPPPAMSSSRWLPPMIPVIASYFPAQKWPV